jgi:L-serine dehydratase
MANMKSLKDIFVLGPGPSSSHTIGPYNIANHFRKSLKDQKVDHIDVTLFASLAFTGKGHLTDAIIKKALEDYKVEVLFDTTTKVSHPNTMKLIAYFIDGSQKEAEYISYGGGAFGLKGEPIESPDVYPFSNFAGLRSYMEEKHLNDVYEVIEEAEGKDILTYAEKALNHMFETINKGLDASGILPGKLKLKRVAGEIYQESQEMTDEAQRRLLLLSSYAYATAEENAAGDFIITAPTCGSAGVVPSVLYYEYTKDLFPKEKYAKALLVGGLIGNFVKANASISGAVHGCQAEIGTAASMATASLCYLYGLNLHQIEYGAEVAMEHFLGLTCDPVQGYVQIPCIERNAMASIHAYTAFIFAKEISLIRQNQVSFDQVVEAMKETGDSLPYQYKETSLGGLADIIKDKKD